MEITVKNSWEDISLGDYQQLVNVINTDSDLLTKELQVLEILTNKTYDELSELTTLQVKQLLTHTRFLNTEITPEFKYEYELDGQKYIPKLLIEDYEAGRFVDIQSYLKNPTENLHLIVASVLDKKVEQPKWKVWKGDTIESYGDKDVKALSNTILESMPITQVNGLADFFLRNYVALWTTIEDYSEKSLEETIQNLIATQHTGDGSSQLAELVKNEA